MENSTSENPSQKQAVGSSRERKLAVCAGTADLTPLERTEMLTILVTDADEVVAQSAQQALQAQPVESFIEALKNVAAPRSVFAYAAKSLTDQPGISEVMAQNQSCPAEFLVPVIPYLSSSAVQALAGDLYRVSESPGLAAALQQSNLLNTENKMLMEELLSDETGIDEAALEEAALEAEPDAARRKTLLQRLASMTVAQRVQLAVKGGSEERRTLIRDSSKVVQRAVLQSPRLTDQEVEAFATMSNLSDEILRLIANNRNFRKNYSVVRNLLNNPKTPLDVSLHMLPIANAMDLKRLTMNKNIPETLRSTATKLQRQRQETRK